MSSKNQIRRWTVRAKKKENKTWKKTNKVT
jgi:hypothetical protein